MRRISQHTIFRPSVDCSVFSMLTNRWNSISSVLSKVPAKKYFQKYFYGTEKASDTGAKKRTLADSIFSWKGTVIGTYLGIQKSAEILEDDTNPHKYLFSDNTMKMVSLIPTRFLSRIWGGLTQIELPVSLRVPVLNAYCATFGAEPEEAQLPLEKYTSINDFFTRRLKPEVRKISNTPLVSPVDGRVLHFGKVEDGHIEQIKGIKYKVESFLGEKDGAMKERLKMKPQNGRDLYYATIYLAPGDYHGFHSPASWTIHESRHFPGHLYSVSPLAARLFKDLFVVNERVCLNGEWDGGLFSMTAVGAYNVGSVTLEFDDKFKTNQSSDVMDTFTDSSYKDVTPSKGDCLGFFNFGSTIVLVFEAGSDFKWSIEHDQKIRLGEPVGVYSKQ